MRGMDLNHRPLAYEASELPLLYPAIVTDGKCIGGRKPSVTDINNLLSEKTTGRIRTYDLQLEPWSIAVSDTTDHIN